MHQRHLLAIVVYLVVQAAAAQADSWAVPQARSIYSENRDYRLDITPDARPITHPGHCLAKLMRVDGKEPVEIWSRYLVNNVSPVEILVANSGKYVVTFDEWADVGVLPVVIYGDHGRLIHVHTLDSLKLNADPGEILHSLSGEWWSEDSLSFFGPKAEELVMRLHWGQTLLIDLESGDLIDGEWREFHSHEYLTRKKLRTLDSFVQFQLERRAMAMLDSDDSEQRRIGARICGQERVQRAIPKLQELLTDQAHNLRVDDEGRRRVYTVREAAVEALRAMRIRTGTVILEEPVPDR